MDGKVVEDFAPRLRSHRPVVRKKLLEQALKKNVVWFIYLPVREGGRVAPGTFDPREVHARLAALPELVHHHQLLALPESLAHR